MIENNTIANEIAQLNETETHAVLEYISKLKTGSKKRATSAPDELIVALSDAYENKRARQVFEWDKVRRRNV